MKWLKEKIFSFLNKSKSSQFDQTKIIPPFDVSYEDYEFDPDVIAYKHAMFDEYDSLKFYRYFSEYSYPVQDFGNELGFKPAAQFFIAQIKMHQSAHDLRGAGLVIFCIHHELIFF